MSSHLPAAGRLESYPRIPLADAPTPLQEMPRLAAAIGVKNLWVKRDDLTGLGAGGNKARKLEYLVADALAKGCDHLVTTGGAQSNHARMTAAAANRAGMGCTLVLGDPDPGNRAGNLILDEVLGAEVVFLGDVNLEQMDAGMDREIARLRSQGKKPYLIPVGGSTPIGELGYVEAMREFAEQAEGKGIDTIVLAVGSAGTAAGVAMGIKVYAPHMRLMGVSVSRSVARLGTRVADMANEVAGLLDVPQRVAADEVEVTDEYVGPGYGLASEAGLSAMLLAARTEGLLLDPVYTGKAMSGLIGLAKASRFAGSTGVCFWHTGGLPALFAFESDILAAIRARSAA